MKTVTKLQRPQQTPLLAYRARNRYKTSKPLLALSQNRSVLFPCFRVSSQARGNELRITINIGAMLGHSTKRSYAADDALIKHTHRRKTYVIGMITWRRFISSVRLHPARRNLPLHGPSYTWITYITSPH